LGDDEGELDVAIPVVMITKAGGEQVRGGGRRRRRGESPT